MTTTKTMTTHNAGPWKWQPGTSTIRTAKENYWLATLDSWDGMVKPHNDANARLISAAPELLEALQAFIALERAETTETADDVLARAERAIAKAKGQQ